MAEWIVEVPDEIAASLEWSLDQGAMFGDEEVAELRRLGVHVEPGMWNLFEHIVKTNNAFKVEIFSDEHPPPHFRVLYAGESNCFRIDDCSPMYEKGLKRYWKNIREWHNSNKQTLIDTWNRTRPSGCDVGAFRE